MGEGDPTLDALLRLIGPGIADILAGKRIELKNVEMDIGEMELFIPIGGSAPFIPPVGPVTHPPFSPPPVICPDALIPDSFSSVSDIFPGKVREVTLGATRAEGGSRGKTVTVGGSTSLPFTHPAALPPHPPVISMDVFDKRVPMPKALIGHLGEVLDDPAEWARVNVEKYGADMVTIHLLSTDPLLGDASPKAAAKTVESVLQAVDVPVVIGGCGDPKKDALVFTEIAAIAEGERLLLNSVTTDMVELRTLEPVARAAEKHGHCLLSFTGLDLNSAKELNRRIYQYFPPERLMMDLTTVALGYGLEYSYSIHERARIAALMGDNELSHPTISACTNAWSAREAWMDLGPKYGKREIRGPLWEALGGITLLLAGVDLFFMMHPLAITTVREVASRLMNVTPFSGADPDWVSAGF